MKLPALLLSILCAISIAAFAQKPAPKAANAGPLAAIEDQAGLPRALLIGDSISIGYTQPVSELLKCKANLYGIRTNSGHPKSGATLIEKWLGTGKWDAIHFNWGIHDSKFMPDGKRRGH